VGSLRLPDEVRPPEELLVALVVLVGLDATRCVAVVEAPGGAWWTASFVDLERGELLRVERLDHPRPPGPIEAGGALALHVEGGVALRESDGTPRWQVELARALPLAGDAAHVAVRVLGSGVAVLGVNDGRRRASIPSDLHGAVFAQRGELLLGARPRPEEGLAVVEAWTLDGAQRWSRQLGCAHGGSVSLHPLGDVLVGASVHRYRAQEATALDLATGETLWRRATLEDETLVLPAGGLLLAAGRGGLRRFGPT